MEKVVNVFVWRGTNVFESFSNALVWIRRVILYFGIIALIVFRSTIKFLTPTGLGDPCVGFGGLRRLLWMHAIFRSYETFCGSWGEMVAFQWDGTRNICTYGPHVRRFFRFQPTLGHAVIHWECNKNCPAVPHIARNCPDMPKCGSRGNFEIAENVEFFVIVTTKNFHV